MRYVVFSDVHGNSHAFERFVNDIKLVEHDRVVFLGDFVGYYYQPEKIINYCIENRVLCLLGNHDDYFIKMLDGKLCIDVLVEKYGHSYVLAKEQISQKSVEFLRSLGSSCDIFEDNAAGILFCHGSPVDPLNGRVYPDTDLTAFDESVQAYDFVVCGHTHHKMVRPHDSTLFLNPGSLGQQRDGLGCSYLIIDTCTSNYSFRVVSYDISKLEADIDAHDSGSQRLKEVLKRSPR